MPFNTRKKYYRRSLKNASDLEYEKEWIRLKYKKIEANFLFSVLGPVLPSIASAAFRKKTNPWKSHVAVSGKSSAQNASKSTVSRINAVLKIPLVKYLTKSWLRWQAFNLAFFLGKKLVVALRHSKRSRN
jgi:hypothetical protein